MKVKKWLTIGRNGSARITKGKPGLDWDEIAIQLDIELPDALFQRPRLAASITVPEEAAATDVIDTIVADNVQEAIEQATGLEFSISICHPKPEGSE